MVYRNFIVYLLLLFLCLGTLDAHSLNKRDQVEQIYLSQLGVREQGNNAGFEIKQYLASAGLTEGYAWCASFIHWCLIQVGLSGPAVHPAYSPSWFTPDRTIYIRGMAMAYRPQRGDVFGIYFPKKERIAHVGFIHRWEDGNYATTVEGNTNEAGSREGDGVYKKYRLKSQIYKVSNWINE